MSHNHHSTCDHDYEVSDERTDAGHPAYAYCTKCDWHTGDIRPATTTPTSIISAADWSMFMEMTEPQQNAWIAEQWFRVTSEPFDPGLPFIDDDQPEQWEIEENAGPTLVDVRQYRWPGTPDAEEYVATVEANRDGPAWSQVAC
jgi:hypothetical protein